MSALTALLAAGHRVVEAEGFHWRLRRVRSRELLEAGGDGLLAVLPRMVGSSPPDMATILQELAAHPDIMGAQIDRADALVAASVEAVSQDGQTWERCELVLLETDADPAQGRLPVTVLSSKGRQALAEAVQEHSLRASRGSL